VRMSAYRIDDTPLVYVFTHNEGRIPVVIDRIVVDRYPAEPPWGLSLNTARDPVRAPDLPYELLPGHAFEYAMAAPEVADLLVQYRDRLRTPQSNQVRFGVTTQIGMSFSAEPQDIDELIQELSTL
jgi:hypothetical protein